MRVSIADTQSELFRLGETTVDARTRPRGQLLKWVGNKFKYAEIIARQLPDNLGTYYEPFVGTAAVLATLAPPRAIAGDSLSILIDLLRLVQRDPDRLVKHYASARVEILKDGREGYEAVKARYNAGPNPEDLLVLSRTCYGGVMRFTREGFISTPMGPHKPMPAEKLQRYMLEWQARLRGTSFACRDFRETMNLAKAGDTVYCDPPYLHGQAILYGAQDFDLQELWEAVGRSKNRGVNVAVSVDGWRRSGEKPIELGIPEGVFERELLIERGGCMLRRFQMMGADMAFEQVADRLLLTW